MKKLTKIMAVFSLIMMLLPNVVEAYTQEIAKTHPYYIHPVTGVIEDAGNNPGIGQGMTENVLSPQALVEESGGRYFLTVRYNLANYIKNEGFAVQNRGDESFYSVSAEVTASTEETKDYRFEIPSKDVVVRSTFFVGPMGRDVIFYYDLSDFTPGNTDFVTLASTEEVEKTKQNTISALQSTEVAKSQSTEVVLQSTVQPKANVAMELPPAAPIGEKIETKAVNSKMSAGELGYNHGLLMNTSPIIQKIYGRANIKEEIEDTKEKAPMGDITKAFIYMFLGTVALITTSLVLISVGTTIYLKKIARENDILKESIYEG